MITARVSYTKVSRYGSLNSSYPFPCMMLEAYCDNGPIMSDTRKKREIPDKYAVDKQFIAGSDGFVSVPGYQGPHLLRARHADGRAARK